MIEIDGSAGEGGGQILRTSLALSMCTGQAFELVRIRARRPKPGLMRQHLACVNAAAAVSGAEVDGAALGASSLRFKPNNIRAGAYRFVVGSAGSCTLVLQTVWPALMWASESSEVRLSGGTHNPMAPPFHFLAESFAPLMQRLGSQASLQLHRMGFYPAGGGEMTALIQPAREQLQPFDVMSRGDRQEPYAQAMSPALPRAVSQRELAALGAAMGWSASQLRTPAVRQNEGPGNVLMAVLPHAHVCEVVSQYGEKGISAEQVAQRLAVEVQDYERQPGALGPHLADQWMLPLALAVWRRQTPASFTATALTEHALTNAQVIERFLPVQVKAGWTPQGWRVDVSPRLKPSDLDT